MANEKKEETVAIVPTAQKQVVDFDPSDPVTLYMKSDVFDQLQRVALLMCSSGLVPAHLHGKEHMSDCFLVAAQAFRWKMDPFSVAQHTFVLSGKLGYEGKLIAAVVNAHPHIETHLNYTYSGAGAERHVAVSGRLKGETVDRVIEGDVKQWKTQNQTWNTMPDQMLAYRGAREWARRHMPEAVLGMQADEEVVEVVDMERRGGAFVTVDSLSEIGANVVTAEVIPEPYPIKAEAFTHPASVVGEDDGKPTPRESKPKKSREPGEDDDDAEAKEAAKLFK
jgi:hypothetical protein